jgi:hypothetical protein
VTAREVLDGIRVRAKAYTEHGTPGLAAPYDRKALLAAAEAVLALADEMEAQPPSEIGTIRGVGVILRAAIENALEGQ